MAAVWGTAREISQEPIKFKVKLAFKMASYQPSIDMVNLRSPHVPITKLRPQTRREYMTFQFPVHKVIRIVNGEGILPRAYRGTVRSSHSKISTIW